LRYLVRSHYPNPDPMPTEPMKPRLAHGLCPALLPEARSSSVVVIIHLTLISRSDWLASTVPLPLRHCDHLFLSVSLHTTRHEYYQLNPQLVAHLSLRRCKHCLLFHFELPGPTIQTSTAATTASATSRVAYRQSRLENYWTTGSRLVPSALGTLRASRFPAKSDLPALLPK
jgi:hypothetical protein